MQQLSRPYLLILAAVAAIGAFYMLVLRPHENPGSGSSVHVSHATLPGVRGLAADVAKARGAVALSQHNANDLAAKSAASGAGAGASAPASAAKPVVHPATPAHGAPSPSAPVTGRPSASADRSGEVAHALAQNKIVVILFWDSAGADDQAVMSRINDVSRRHGDVVVMTATPTQLASFGTVTQGVQIMETPTTLVINRQGQATTITGLTDGTEINQAVIDSERGSGAVQTPKLASFVGSSNPRSAFIARANHSCHAIGAGKGGGSLSAQATSFSHTVTATLSQANSVRSLGLPGADRVTLDRWFGMLSRSMGEVGAAQSAVSAHHWSAARASLFASQSDFDRGSQGLADYGLTSCFSLESKTS